MIDIIEPAEIPDIVEVLSNPDVNDRISGDTPGKWDIDTLPINENYRYIGGYINNKIIALCIYSKKKDYNIMHFQVMPDFRRKYAREFARKVLKMKGALPLYAITPECYLPVVNFAVKLGFKVVGKHTDPFIKNGVKYNQIVTRFSDGFF